jgi:hypothetical protein
MFHMVFPQGENRQGGAWVERLRVAMRWKVAVFLTAMALGLAVWRVDSVRSAPAVAATATAVVRRDPQADQQAMFEAVKRLLESAHVPPQDMPKQIIAVKAAGGGRYQVHMQMVQGDGWFELTWDGHGWTAQGVNPPQ